MNDLDQKQLIRRQILLVLNDCGTYLLPEPILLSQVNVVVAPALTLQELRSALEWLETHECIIGINPALGGSKKWKISENGKTLI